MFYIYKLIFYQFQKNNKIEESEKVFSKFLLPVHQKFYSHSTLFKSCPTLKLEAKIKVYTLKVLNNLENAKILCENEDINNKEREKFEDELELQNIDLDFNTIHSEILENIIFDENDSGLSDFDTTVADENPKKKIFEINKIKKIIHKSVESLFSECQNDEQYKPLIQQEKKINKENIIQEKGERGENIEKDEIEISNNNENENKTQDYTNNTVEYIEIKNENEKQNKNEKNSIDKKEKNIISYKKYNYLNDPNSNYNNFTKKFIVEISSKKRFRDFHPFLKDFNPKFLKKENIDKKIFRKFRKFFKLYYKDNKNSPIFSKNVFFWKKFYTQNLLPPVKVENNGEIIEHKSFNTQYLIWLFNQEGTSELFKLFLEKESENVMNNFISKYNLYKSDEPNIIEKLKQYLEYIPEIYCKDNNEEKNIPLEENKEIFDIDTNQFSKAKEENNIFTYNNNLENIEWKNKNSDPFNLNFDLIGKKYFKEDSFDSNELYFFKKSEESDNMSERFELDDSLSKQLSNNFYK